MAYSYQRTITVDYTKVSGSISNFPLLISGTYSYLATVANGGRLTNSSGYDLVVSLDASASVILSHEIEKYDPVTGGLVLHVKTPILSSSVNSVFYLNYGDASVSSSLEQTASVWSNGYESVYHLSGSIDSKGAHNGTHNNVVPVNGKIDGASFYNGSTSRTDLGTGILTSPSALALSAWVSHTASIDHYNNIIRKDTLYLRDYVGGVIVFQAGLGASTLQTPTTNIGDTNMHLVYGTWDGTTSRIYLDGVLLGQAATSASDPGPSVPTYIGTAYIGVEPYNGTIDEVRISAVARSTGWIWTEYQNQNSPSTFYSIGVESAGSTPIGYRYGRINNTRTIKQSESNNLLRRLYFRLTDSQDRISGKVISTSGVKMMLVPYGGSPTLSTNSITAIDMVNQPGEYYLELTAVEVGTLGCIIGTLAVAGTLGARVQVNVVAYDSTIDGINDPADKLLDVTNTIETGLSVRQFLRLASAVLFGQTSGTGELTVAYRSVVNSLNIRVISSQDAAGNRSNITTDST